MEVRQAFAVLGLDETAVFGDVRVAYRDLVKVWHPDRFVGDSRLEGRAAEMLRTINEAYEILQHHFAKPREQAHAPAAKAPRAETVVDTPSSQPTESVWKPLVKPLFVMLAFSILVIMAIVSTEPRGLPGDLKTATDSAPNQSFENPKSATPKYVPESALEPLVPRAQPPNSGYVYAESASDLGFRITGSWLVDNHVRFELRDGVVRRTDTWARSGGRMWTETIVGYYEPLTGRRLLFRPREAPKGKSVEVAFASSTMLWFETEGVTVFKRPPR